MSLKSKALHKNSTEIPSSLQTKSFSTQAFFIASPVANVTLAKTFFQSLWRRLPDVRGDGAPAAGDDHVPRRSLRLLRLVLSRLRWRRGCPRAHRRQEVQQELLPPDHRAHHHHLRGRAARRRRGRGGVGGDGAAGRGRAGLDGGGGAREEGREEEGGGQEEQHHGQA